MAIEDPGYRTHQVTRALHAVARGEAGAAAELLPLVYGELRKLAAARMARIGPGQTLQTTGLVHEAWLRLGGNDAGGWDDRRHFYGAAARAMRNILVDQARRRARLKRGGDRRREGDVEELASPPGAPVEDLISLDAALDRLESEFPRQARVIMLRYFAGLSIDEIAQALDLSTRTVERDWHFARTWLRREVGAQEPGA